MATDVKSGLRAGPRTAAYLARRTGSLDAWQQAQQLGWARRTAWPWEGLAAGWGAARSATSTDLVISRWADLLFAFARAGAGRGAARPASLARRDVRRAERGCAGLLDADRVGAEVRADLVPGVLAAGAGVHRPGWRWVRVATPLGCLPILAYLAFSFARHE